MEKHSRNIVVVTSDFRMIRPLRLRIFAQIIQFCIIKFATVVLLTFVITATKVMPIPVQVVL